MRRKKECKGRGEKKERERGPEIGWNKERVESKSTSDEDAWSAPPALVARKEWEGGKRGMKKRE